MKSAWLAATIAVGLAACASGSGPLDASSPGVVTGASLTPAQAQSQVREGATKTQVRASLGPANVIAFDSGWEVWVYRWPGADRSTRSATELVVLFDAQGSVRKSRIRPGYAS